jgi:hypothetical protein
MAMNPKLLRPKAASHAAPPVPTDPLFADVSLLLHFDGTNESTSFSDSSSNGLTVTANGNAQISTAQSKFGGSSYYCQDSVSDFLEIATAGSQFLFAGDYTIEAWMWFVALNADMSVYYSYISSEGYLALNITPSDFNVYFQSISPDFAPAHSVPVEQWVHVAMVRSNGTVSVYQDGTLLDSVSSGGTHGHSAPESVRICNTGGNELYVDEFRITKAARYTGAFTPPDAPFPDQ